MQDNEGGGYGGGGAFHGCLQKMEYLRLYKYWHSRVINYEFYFAIKYLLKESLTGDGQQFQ